MTHSPRTIFAASTVALSLAVAPAGALAQNKKPKRQDQTTSVSGGTSGGVAGRDVTASTYGTGTVTRSPDGYSIGVTGGGDATAENGTATVETSGRVTEKRAMSRSTATAMTEEERARSRTRTMVQPNDTVRSRTTSWYKEDGSRPVRETVTTVVKPDGTTSTSTKASKPR